MSQIYREVSKFMQGKASAYDVMSVLNCLDMVIIRLNVSDFGYESDRGPYIMIWRTECDHAMIWGSRDDFFTDCAYRMTCDDDDNVKLRQSLVNACKDKFTAVCVTLDDHDGFVGRMRQNLDLDSDLYRGSRTDREIGHGYIKRVFDSVAVLAPTETTQQTQVSQTGVSEMSQAQTKVTAIVARAKNATMTAASLQAGKALNAAALKAAKAKAPMMLRGYLDHPVAPAVIAIGLVSVTEFIPAGPSRDKIAKAADLMLTAAIAEGADKYLNVEKMIDQVFSGLPDEAKDLIGQGV
ncbi:hypothetical protein IACHDJAJ_00004 [Aeromonas phage vB_AdhS_TS3]|nr:hypothetical protein IACHDJAJ_00004 [Aeromonas phage vB_AdhS_TS3]